MYHYPSAPKNVDPHITEPSVVYKTEVVKSVFAILFFVVSYIILFAAASILAFYCVLAGFFIITHITHLIGILAGAGVILIGLLIFYFVIKFIFKSYKNDQSNLVEITEEEQPELFSFIRNITIETQAPFPKKIFLSNEVNASVFYDSSFWSMFLPVKKNLLIGLGLVNSINLSEFKAILAHEFGHFSQKSMKVGSYVYNSNRIIHNLLFDNGGFYKTLNSIAQVHYVLYICMNGVSGLVRLIQKTLNAIYLYINKQNMKLSREMEFHADSVAASVAGSSPLIHSLYRLELAEASYNNLLNMCNLLLKEKKFEKNIYSSHATIMLDFAKVNNISFKHNLPEVHRNSFQNFAPSRINIQNQWASHPSTEDREDALLRLNIVSEEITVSAWEVFVNKEKLQESLTQKLYESTTKSDEDIYELKCAEKKYFEMKVHFELPDYLHGYWDDKSIPSMDFEEIKLSNDSTFINYNMDDINLSKQLVSINNDIATLDAIDKKEILTNSFDFNGIKYSRKEAATLSATFKTEREALKKTIHENNKHYIHLHYLVALHNGKATAYISNYKEVELIQEQLLTFNKYHQEIFDELLPLFQGIELNIDDAKDMVRRMQNKETLVKEFLQKILDSTIDWIQLKGKPEQILNNFINSNRTYLNNKSFEDENIRTLLSSLDELNQILNELSFIKKKKLFLITA